MLVMVDEPTAGAYYGSLVAAPVVSKVFQDALPLFGYFPEYTDEEYKELEVTIKDYTGQNVDKVTATLESQQLKVEKIGKGDTVITSYSIHYTKLYEPQDRGRGTSF